MPRLLLVARNPGLAFGLASASDDIIEVRPSLVGRLAVSPGMADVVVIEQEHPGDALTTLDLLRTGGLLAPALLVASARPEWAEFDPGTRPSVAVLDPPINQDRLEHSVGSTAGLPDADSAAAEPAMDPVAEVEPEPEPLVAEQAEAERAHDLPVPDHVEVVFSDALIHEAALQSALTESDPAESDPAESDPAESDSTESVSAEELPIAAAAADASTPAEDTVDVDEVEDEALSDAARQETDDLPDGPPDLEPAGDPYTTATHVDLAEEDDLVETVFEAAPSVSEPEGAHSDRDDDLVAADATAEVGETDSTETDGTETDSTEEAVAPELVAGDEAYAEGVVAEAVPGDDAPALEPPDDAAGEPAGEATDQPTDEADESTDPLDLPDSWGSTDAERVLDTAMLAIPAAAPMRQPEEIRLGTVGRTVLPAVVLYDEEDSLSVAEGTPSPAAWQAGETEPVLAWQGTGKAKDGRVYAEMASLVAASGELLADEPEIDEVPISDADDDVPSVDLSQVFGEPHDRPAWPDETPNELLGVADDEEAPIGAVLGLEVLAANEAEPEAPLPVEAETEAALAHTVPEPRAHVELVDLRDQLVDDPRSTPSLVRALLARSHEVYGVSEAGALVVGDALARTGAGAGALLLPDGDSWRVAAGEGLRRLEHRYVLGADSWLVTTIASRHKGIIIDRTDVARRPLAGAPLAAHKHLVAAPVRAVAGILLIARDDDPPFSERDLLSLARLAEASAGILASALDARQLARLLGDIRDQDDRTAAERIDYGL